MKYGWNFAICYLSRWRPFVSERTVMFRFWWAIFANLFRVPGIMSELNRMAKHKGDYSEEEKLKAIENVISIIKRTLHIHTKVFGRENLPESGGYIMYSNHQGKYDALGIFAAHDRMCSVVMDEAKSHAPITSQVVDICDGKRMVLNDLRSGAKIIGEMGAEAAEGKRFMIFPEGGYNHNKNRVMDFKAGCFKASLKSKTPIVPVAIVDSYKAFEGIRFGRIDTEVHFLKPIAYEEYKDMKTVRISEMVRSRIVDKVNGALLERAENKSLSEETQEV